MNLEEQQYLNNIKALIETGITKQDRTGVGTKSLWGQTLRFDLSKGFPLMTTRFVSAKVAIEEMLFIMRGERDTKKLEAVGVNVWRGNTSKEFLEKRGLRHLDVGDYGELYGPNMRSFGASETYQGFDQLAYVIENIKTNPNDRRHVISYYNPASVHKAVLFPCPIMIFFEVADGRLNSMLTQRSVDTILGLITNLAGLAFLTHVIARLTGYDVGEMVHVGANSHIYLNHVEGAKELLTREPKPFPQFRFKKDFSTLDEALALSYGDCEITGYEHCGKMKFEMAV